MVDNFLSFIFSNNIIVRKNNKLHSFILEEESKKIEVYYSDGYFFINAKDSIGQPHVIPHWNFNEDKNFHRLCLTMDGDDRRSGILSSEEKLNRIKQIIFEQWDDKISERFRELNTRFQSKLATFYYIDNKNILRNIKDNIECKMKNMDIDYLGENKKEILSKIKSKKDEITLINIKYKNEVKKLVLCTNVLYKLNDLTDKSFFGRTGKTKIEKKIIIVGAGSIGGLIIDFLAKSGVPNIEIWDDDIMDVANNTRHVLPIESKQINKNKTDHFIDYYSPRYPSTKFSGIFKKFKYDNKNMDLNDKIIINTTGGSLLNSLKNFIKIYKTNKRFKYVDFFVEPFGMAVHCIVATENEKDEIIKNMFLNVDERFISTSEKDFRKNFDGCFVPSLPYGFASLQVGVNILISMLLRENFKSGHFTVPLLSMVPNQKKNLNLKLSKNIDPYKIGIIEW